MPCFRSLALLSLLGSGVLATRQTSSQPLPPEAIRPRGPVVMTPRQDARRFLMNGSGLDIGRFLILEPANSEIGGLTSILRPLLPTLGLDPEMPTGARIERIEYRPEQQRLHLNQAIDGIPVFGAHLVLELDASGGLRRWSGNLVPEAQAFLASRRVHGHAFTLSLEQALQRLSETSRLTLQTQRPIYFADGGTLVPAYDVEVQAQSRRHHLVLSANDGRLLFRDDGIARRRHDPMVDDDAPFVSPSSNDPRPSPAADLATLEDRRHP